MLPGGLNALESGLSQISGSLNRRQAIDRVNDLVWDLATSCDESSRDGMAAVKLSKVAQGFCSNRDWHCLSIWAAAYAEADQFGKAIELQKDAIALAPNCNEERTTLQRLLEQYQEGIPCRQKPRG